jgi:hypothetical protein
LGTPKEWFENDRAATVIEHPLYRMWRDRLDAEVSASEARAARRAAREAERAEWYEAWHTYKARLGEIRERIPNPRWYDLAGWVRLLIRLRV